MRHRPLCNGLAYNWPACNGPAYNGPACNGPAYKGPAYNGPAYNGESLGWTKESPMQQRLRGCSSSRQ